jgi:hypothetical protein
MKKHLIVSLVVSLTLLAVCSVRAEDAKSPELKVLDRWIGNWTDQVTLKTPEEKKGEGQSTGAWVAGGRFVQVTGSSKLDDSEAMHMITYDEQERTYRHWFFHSTGMTSRSTGTWDEKTKTMNWIDESGMVAVTEKFTDDNTREWKVVVKAGGQTVFEMEGKSTRKKAP